MAITARKSSSAALAGAGKAVSKGLHGQRGRGLIAAAPAAAEVLLALALGAAALSLVYALFAPLPVPETLPANAAGSAATARPPAQITETPFRTAAIEASAPEPEIGDDFEETRLDLKLHGVFAMEGVPTAIISTPDGQQGNFRLGEEIWNNVTLERVISPVQVVIMSSGVGETLTLINRDPREERARASSSQPQSQVSQSQAASSPAPAFNTGMGFGDVVNISAIPGADGLRLVVKPGPNRKAFDASGLKAGDVIIAVNNRRLGADLAAEASRFASLAKAGRVELTVERDGVTAPVTLELRGSGG